MSGGKIADILKASENVAEAQVIDCGNRVLMPGLIDAHWHSILAAIPQMVAMTSDIAYVHLVAAQEAQRTLMRGFTTVRDMGGPSFALKRAIDEKRIPGPRIYPSGAMVSQTSGHGDFRQRSDIPRHSANDLSLAESAGIGHSGQDRRAAGGVIHPSPTWSICSFSKNSTMPISASTSPAWGSPFIEEVIDSRRFPSAPPWSMCRSRTSGSVPAGCSMRIFRS